jgi:hypothetical protein
MVETQLSGGVMRVRDPQYREIYSNNSQTSIGSFDLSILFQKTSEVIPGQMGIIDQLSVTFSPQHFKALVRSLNETLSAYEVAFGELSIPDADTAPQRTATEIIGMVNEQRKLRKAATASSAEPSIRSKPSRAAYKERAT